MHIKQKIAVITGGASGMGAQTARFLATAGATVILLDREIKAAQEVANDISGFAFACDVSDAANVERVFAEIIAEHGTPQICINCAGICPGQLIVDKNGSPMPLTDFIPAIQVNLIGTFNVLRVASAYMSSCPLAEGEEERGVIINTASVAAYEGQIGQIAYSASKGGVVAMTLPAARELARYGIRVVTIAPGLIETPMLSGLSEKVRESLAASVPFPSRLGKTAEYAKLVLHIIDNTLLNGCVIRLDGALRMAPK